MSWKVVATSDNTVTVWDGESWVVPGERQFGKATIELAVGAEHGCLPGDDVELTIRKVVVPSSHGDGE